MLEADLIRSRPPLGAEFRISLGVNLLHVLSIVLTAPQYEGFDPWVYATNAALPAKLKADMELVLALLKKSNLLHERTVVLAPDDPAQRDFGAFLDRLDSFGVDGFRKILRSGLTGWFDHLQASSSQEISFPSLEEPEGLRTFLGTMPFPEECQNEAIRLIRDPAQLKTRYLSVLTRFWEAFYAEEYARCLPVMERSVDFHRRQKYTGDFSTLFTAVTGRLLPEERRSYEEVEEVVFIPSCHIGPYVSTYLVRDERATLVLIYNCRSTGMPVEKRAAATKKLFPPLKALADETRLQILSLLDGQELYAQQIAKHLGITHPAVSRHLQLMVTADVLTVRKEGGMKYYCVNEKTLAALGSELGVFRSKGAYGKETPDD